MKYSGYVVKVDGSSFVANVSDEDNLFECTIELDKCLLRECDHDAVVENVMFLINDGVITFPRWEEEDFEGLEERIEEIEDLFGDEIEKSSIDERQKWASHAREWVGEVKKRVIEGDFPLGLDPAEGEIYEVKLPTKS